MTRTFPLATLPRSAMLTDSLVAPSSPRAELDMLAIRDEVVRSLSESVGAEPNLPLRINSYILRTTRNALWCSTKRPGFQWTPLKARRVVGLEAVRTYWLDRNRMPSRAVDQVIAGLRRSHEDADYRIRSLAQWLRRQPESVVAIVQAEATNWATQLSTSLDWGRLGRHVRFGLDASTVPIPGRPISLLGRVDVAIDGSRRAGRGSVLLSMMNGIPRDSTPMELGLAALVVSLNQDEPPERVVGFWPSCGRALALTVDDRLLKGTAVAVASAVKVLCRPAGNDRVEKRRSEN
jgi:hypothetical protein